MLTTVSDISVNQTIWRLNETDTAYDAAVLMTERDISAVLIYDKDERLVGIVTERDIARRVVAEGRDPKSTGVRDMMTRDVETIEPGESNNRALRIMQARRIRHLPIVEEGRVVGIVSMRDLRRSRAQTFPRNVGRVLRRTFRKRAA